MAELEDPESREEEGADEDFPMPEDNLAQVLAQLGEGSTRLEVYRSTPGGNEFCFSLNGTEYTPERLAEWGGGRYVLRVLHEGRLVRVVEQRIATPPESRTEGRANGAGGAMVDVYREQRDFLQSTLATVLRHGAGAGDAQAPRSPLAEIKPFVEMLMPVLSRKEDGAERGLDLLMRGIELGKELGGVGDWKSEAVSAFKAIVPDLKGVIAPRAPAAAPGSGTPAEGAEAESLLKGALDYLKGPARMGVDPAVIGNWIVVNANNPTYAQYLETALTKPIEFFVERDAQWGAAPYRDWLVELLDGLRAAYSEEDQVAPDPGGPGGDAGDPASDGPASTGGGDGSPDTGAQ